MTPSKPKLQVSLRLTPKQAARLAELMEVTGLNRSEVFQELLMNSTIVYKPMPAGSITIYEPKNGGKQ